MTEATQGQPKTLEWNDISDPGCYVQPTSGVLFRVSEEGLSGDQPAIQMESKDAGHRRVVRLSENPDESDSTLRERAEETNLTVSF